MTKPEINPAEEIEKIRQRIGQGTYFGGPKIYNAVKFLLSEVTRWQEMYWTSGRVSTIYQKRVKKLGAVLIDAQGLVRGMDTELDQRIENVLNEAGFTQHKLGPLLDEVDQPELGEKS